MERIYTPGYYHVYEREIAQLAASPLSEANKALVQRFCEHLFATGSGELRVAKLSSQARRLCERLGKDLPCATLEDIQRVIAECNRSPHWSDATKADYRRCLKQLYKWLEESDARLRTGDERERLDAQRLYKYLREQVRIAYRDPSHSYSDIILEEDLQQVLEKGCQSAKQRAFLAVLHESGFRVGEILPIKRKDLEFKHDRVLIKVDGKTGERRAPLVWSMGYLARWLDEHPRKDDPEAYVWVSESRHPEHARTLLKHGGAQKMLNRCFELAGVRKQHNFHWFRHSRATLNAPHMSETMLCKFFGWVPGSKQVRRYVHADTGQVEDAVLRMNGLEREHERRIRVQRCACGLLNDANATYCQRCGKPLNAATLLAREERKGHAIEEAFELLQKIMADPALRAKFEHYTQQGS